MSTPGGHDPHGGRPFPYGGGPLYPAPNGPRDQPVNPYADNLYQPAQTGSTDVVSIVGLVLSLMCCTAPAGLVLGVIGLRRTSSDTRSGRPLAWLAVVFGALYTLLGAVVAVLIALAPDDFWEGFLDDLDPWSQVEVGTCFNETDQSGSDGVAIELVDCDDPHDREAYDLADLPNSSWPGQEAVYDLADEACLQTFEQYVGTPALSSRLDYFSYSPTRVAWALGDREVVCALGEPDDEQLIGSMKNSRE